MQTQDPAETGAETAPTAAQQPAEGAVAVTPAADGDPLFTGSPTTLWIGFGAGAFVFLLIFMLALRGRLARGARNRQAENSARARQTEFFQPAGENAEITFDDEPSTTPRSKEPPEQGDLKFSDGDSEITIERHDEPTTPISADRPDPIAPERTIERSSGSAPFAGLFAKKKRDGGPAHLDIEIESKETSPLRSNPAPQSKETAGVRPDDWRRESEREFEEERRRAEQASEDARLHEARDEEAANEFAEAEYRQAEAARRQLADREAAFERRKQTAALDARRHAAEEREIAVSRKEAALDTEFREASESLSRDLDSRFSILNDRLDAWLRRHEAERQQPPETSDAAASVLEAISKDVDDRFQALSAALLETRSAAPDATSLTAFENNDADGAVSALVEMMSKRIAEENNALKASIAALSDRIDAVAGAPVDVNSLREEIAVLKKALVERAAGPSAPAIQLSDIVRNALPPNAFEMRAMLANNRKADCLIRLPQPPGPIAIDAGFPVEAFHRLHAATPEAQDSAENEFRRTALRHIVDIAERLIVPEETAESALMFIPSESMYAELHAQFPDIIQDSYRARVWVVSPTTLMATLHTVRAVIRDSQARESADLIHSEAQHVLGEVDALRRRVVTLEEDFNKARHDVRDVLSSTDQVYRRAETIHNTRRALTESALDRGSRRIPAEPSDTDPHTEETEKRSSHGDGERDGPDLWEDDHDAADDRRDDDDRPRFPLR